MRNLGKGISKFSPLHVLKNDKGRVLDITFLMFDFLSISYLHCTGLQQYPFQFNNKNLFMLCKLLFLGGSVYSV
jgi:hypothetical protein